jgi:hypothetical protein
MQPTVSSERPRVAAACGKKETSSEKATCTTRLVRLIEESVRALRDAAVSVDGGGHTRNDEWGDDEEVRR